MLLVIGGIWTGLFTPTEAAGFGAIGALIIGVDQRHALASEIVAAIFQAGRTTAPIMFLLITAQMYSRLLAIRRSSELHQGKLPGPRRRPVGDHRPDGGDLDPAWAC